MHPAPRLAVLAAVATLAALPPAARAALDLPNVFSDHMVLQRGLAVPVWGWADPGALVTVRFAGKQRTPSADAAGRWMTRLDPPAANPNPQTLEVSCGDEHLSIKDVLVGDVWVCSGQSNMEWPVQASTDAAREIAAANLPLLRLFSVQGHLTSPTPARDLPGTWSSCSPQSAPGFSAVGFFFGRELVDRTEVPIGLVATSWGGTRIEPWTPPAGFRQVPELAELMHAVDPVDPATEAGKAAWAGYLDRVSSWLEVNRKSLADGHGATAPPPPPGFTESTDPTTIYNAMVAPLVPYGVRGAIWYQGESNAGEGEAYFHKLRALIEGWRTVWGQDEAFPLHFYVVQLAGFEAPQESPAGGDGFARVRDGQKRVLELPHTGLVVTTDIGDAADVHPKNKQDVGRRLARWALRDVHQRTLEVSGPLFKEMKVEGNTATIHFDHLGGGLIAGAKNRLEPVKELPADQLAGFAIAGPNQEWHWANASINGPTVTLSSPAVPEPAAVRYAWAANPTRANLYNKDGLPAVPFRTDSW